MNRYLARVLAVSGAAALAALSVPAVNAAPLYLLNFLNPGGTVCASTTSTGVELVNVDGYASISADGKKAAFDGATTATGVSQIYVKDLNTGALTLVSTPGAGVPGNDSSGRPRFSPDGKKVAFYSFASNLVSGDTNNVDDAFVADLTTGAITRISVSATGAQADTGTNPVDEPSFSGDSNLVAFVSAATNLVPGDTNLAGDVFVKNLTTGSITRASTSATGVQGNNNSRRPVMSPDGTKVTFYGPATNLVPGDTNGVDDIFVKTLATGAILRVTAANGVQPDLGSGNADFSPDSSRLAFISDATNLLPTPDTNAMTDVFVKDLVTGLVTLVSSDASGVPANDASYKQTDAWSADGQKIFFASNATNLVPGVAGGGFIKDLISGKVVAAGSSIGTRISHGSARILSVGTPAGASLTCSGAVVQDLSVAPAAPSSMSATVPVVQSLYSSKISWGAPASAGSTPVVRYEYCTYIGTTTSTCAVATNWMSTTATSFVNLACTGKCLKTSRTTLVRAVNFFATGPTAQVTYIA
jgi:Tol biopolymer transport system component